MGVGGRAGEGKLGWVGGVEWSGSEGDGSERDGKGGGGMIRICAGVS